MGGALTKKKSGGDSASRAGVRVRDDYAARIAMAVTAEDYEEAARLKGERDALTRASGTPDEKLVRRLVDNAVDGDSVLLVGVDADDGSVASNLADSSLVGGVSFGSDSNATLSTTTTAESHTQSMRTLVARWNRESAETNTASAEEIAVRGQATLAAQRRNRLRHQRVRFSSDVPSPRDEWCCWCFVAHRLPGLVRELSAAHRKGDLDALRVCTQQTLLDLTQHIFESLSGAVRPHVFSILRICKDIQSRLHPLLSFSLHSWKAIGVGVAEMAGEHGKLVLLSCELREGCGHEEEMKAVVLGAGQQHAEAGQQRAEADGGKLSPRGGELHPSSRLTMRKQRQQQQLSQSISGDWELHVELRTPGARPTHTSVKLEQPTVAIKKPGSKAKSPAGSANPCDLLSRHLMLVGCVPRTLPGKRFAFSAARTWDYAKQEFSDVETWSEAHARLCHQLQVDFVQCPPKSGALAGLCILHADRTPFSAEILRFMLESEGATVVWAVDGLECMLAHRSNHKRFDLTLMGGNLPRLDSHTATELIQEWGSMHGEATAVVGLTTHGDVEQRARQAAEAGQQAHLSIPVAKATLIMCVQKVLQHQAREQAFASLMAIHPRAGRDSPANCLPPKIWRGIMRFVLRPIQPMEE